MRKEWPIWGMIIILGTAAAGFAVQFAVSHQKVQELEKLKVVEGVPSPTLAPELTEIPISFKSIGKYKLLSPMSHEYQRWNNCAPVSVSMTLSYFGISKNQYETARALRSHKDDKHVAPEQIIDYLNSFDLESVFKINGNIETLKLLAENEIPVIVQQMLWKRSDVGHYLVVRGYDEKKGALITNDPYYGPKREYSYEVFNDLWKAFNYHYLPIYRSENEETVAVILGKDWNEQEMYSNALSEAEIAVKNNPSDPLLWLNLGEDYFGVGEYKKAIESFEKADSLGLPIRLLWFLHWPLVAYNELGEYEKTLSVSQRIFKSGNPATAEIYYEQGRAFLGIGRIERAKSAFTQALEYEPNFIPAVEALSKLK